MTGRPRFTASQKKLLKDLISTTDPSTLIAETSDLAVLARFGYLSSIRESHGIPAQFVAIAPQSLKRISDSYQKRITDYKTPFSTKDKKKIIEDIFNDIISKVFPGKAILAAQSGCDSVEISEQIMYSRSRGYPYDLNTLLDKLREHFKNRGFQVKTAFNCMIISWSGTKE